MRRDPKTPAEWQQAVDAAQFFRVVHDAKLYGLIARPKADISRCDEILHRGKRLGYFPKSIDELCRSFLP